MGVQSARGKDLEAPFIAFVGGNHFVLVREVDENGFLVDDIHQKEPERISYEQFNGFWDGKALTYADQPEVAQLLDMESLVGAKGGDDDPVPNPNSKECKNKDSCKNDENPPNDPPKNPPPTPPGTGGGGGGGNPPPPPPPGGPPNGPGSPSRCPTGYNPNVMPFQMSLETTVTDISTTTAGGMAVNFTRNFSNQFGFMRAYYSTWPQDSPFKNNIGNSWNHSFNMHLRVSQYYGAVQYYDEMGDPKTYTKYDTDANYDYYRRGVTAEHEMHGAAYTGFPEEAGIILMRDKTYGTYSMHFPNGMVYRFAAETAWSEHWARLTAIENSSGTQITFCYDALDRLNAVWMPTGDGRFFKFYYYDMTNRIARVELRTVSEVIDAVCYSYDANLNLQWVHRCNSQNDFNDINWYTYGNDPNVEYSYYMATMTDAGGITTSMAYTYASFGMQWGMQAVTLLLERGTSLKTLYSRSTVDVTATVDEP